MSASQTNEFVNWNNKASGVKPLLQETLTSNLIARGCPWPPLSTGSNAAILTEVNVMNRRKFLVGTCALISGLATGIGTGALDVVHAEAAPILGMDPRKVIQGSLDDALWIADGPPSDRQLYVIFAPWCSRSRSLYFATRKRTSGVQLRWVVAGVASPEENQKIVALAQTRSPEMLRAVFEGQSGITPRRFNGLMLNYEQILVVGISELLADFPEIIVGSGESTPSGLASSNGVVTSYPTLAWHDGSVLQAFRGLPSKAQIGRIISSVAPRRGYREREPVAAQFFSASRDPQFARPRIPVSYGYTGVGSRVAYAYPDKNAPFGGLLGPVGAYYAVVGAVANSGWLILKTYQDAGAFVEDPEGAHAILTGLPPAQLKSLQLAATRPTPVYYLPGSGIYKTLERGRGYPDVQGVKVDGVTWVAVKVFNNGSYGFVRESDMSAAQF
jgi:hypothetical protein